MIGVGLKLSFAAGIRSLRDWNLARQHKIRKEYQELHVENIDSLIKDLWNFECYVLRLAK
jgi:hypothetical protein